MAEPDIVDRLLAHRTLGSAPRSELEWLAAHGELLRLEVGDVLTEPGQPIPGMMILFTGQLSIRVDRGAGPRKVMEWQGGDVTGLLPYSRMTKAPGTSKAEEAVDALVIGHEHFPAMIRECHGVTTIVVHVMLDRARHFASSDFQVEKIMSLGRLAAGLAHELNNPASAVARSAATLEADLKEVEAASRALAAARLTADQIAAVDRVRTRCGTPEYRDVLSPLERADRDDELAVWLEGVGLDSSLASALGDSAITMADLDSLAASLNRDGVQVAVRWVAAICAARRLAAEIETAASRIHHLVGAVRGFTYLDQAVAPKPVSIGQDLANTLVVLRAKARAKSVETSLEVDPDLPEFEGYGGELNQVWANLIDNALDAVPPSGRVAVSAAVEGRFIVVRVIDNGPGIPEAVRARVFEPFFTTKPVGDGTGLGLDIARQIVSRHEGTLEFETEPGRTEFRVLLPVAESS